MTAVSSLSKMPRSVELPWAKAAQTRARFVMLLEPGGRAAPERGPEQLISIDVATRDSPRDAPKTGQAVGTRWMVERTAVRTLPV